MLLYIILLLVTTIKANNYFVVICNIDNIAESYLVMNSEYRKIADTYTKDYIISRLYLDPPKFIEYDSLKNLTQGPLIESMDIAEINADTIMLKNMLLFELCQGTKDFLYDVVKISNCYNPSITKWKERYLIACRSNNGYGGPISFGWLDNTTFSLAHEYNYLGIGPELTKINTLSGEDYRIYTINDDKVLISYTFYPQKRFAQMRHAELIINNKTNTIDIINDEFLVPFNSTEKFLAVHEKNWCPFQYKDKILFLKHIDPMITISVTDSRDIHEYEGYFSYRPLSRHYQFFSLANKVDLKWDYGEIHGGTTARRINSDSYLAFFHSKDKLPNSSLITYFFGAFLFDASPPFRIKAFSRAPIVKREFYEGKWSHWLNYVDYIVFPMSYIILNDNFDYNNCEVECQKNITLLISIGTQGKYILLYIIMKNNNIILDIDGWIAKMNLKKLLDTLRSI